MPTLLLLLLTVLFLHQLGRSVTPPTARPPLSRTSWTTAALTVAKGARALPDLQGRRTALGQVRPRGRS